MVSNTQRDKKGNSVDGDFLSKVGGGIAALGVAIYGALRMIKRDRRDEKVASLHDEAIEHVIKTLREEVGRLSVRLAAVEEQNRKCEERNDEMHREILDLKASLHMN